MRPEINRRILPKAGGKSGLRSFSKSDNGNRSVAWVYEQTNKQDNTRPLAATDQPKFYGSAVLNVDEDVTELKGQHWQNRSWSFGLNAAGEITLRRKGR